MIRRFASLLVLFSYHTRAQQGVSLCPEDDRLSPVTGDHGLLARESRAVLSHEGQLPAAATQSRSIAQECQLSREEKVYNSRWERNKGPLAITAMQFSLS